MEASGDSSYEDIAALLNEAVKVAARVQSRTRQEEEVQRFEVTPPRESAFFISRCM